MRQKKTTTIKCILSGDRHQTASCMVLYARHGTRAGSRVLEENILFTERSAGRGDDSRPGVCAPAKSTRVTRHIRRRVAPPSARVSTGVGSARPSIAIQLYSAIQRCTLYSCTALYDTIHTSTTPLSASVLDIQSARNCPDPPRGTRTAPDRAAAELWGWRPERANWGESAVPGRGRRARR